MLRRLLLCLLVVLVSSPSAASGQSIENATIEREEYAVYSAIIVEYVSDETGTFVIANPTTNLIYKPNLSSLQFRVPSTVLLPETFEDFIERNRTNRWLMPKLEIDRKYVLVDYREILKLANDMDHPNTAPGQMMEEWKPFFKEYPSTHGFVTLSRVGFNQQLDQALVHIGWRCPSLCGHWSYLILTKKGGVWKLVDEANRIIS